MRMMLHKTARYGDNEIYPIYEIPNFAGLIALSGYTSLYSNDAVSSHAYKTRHFRVVNNNIGDYISVNIPKHENENGNIIPFYHRFNNLINGRYYIEQDVLESFAAIEQGIRPDDWGTNPNYVRLINASQGMNDSPGGGFGYVDINVPISVSKYDSFESSYSYYEDTKRACLRMFYTQNGNSFTVSKLSYYDEKYQPRYYMSGRNVIGNIANPQYAYTDNDNTVLLTASGSTLSVECYVTGNANPGNYFPVWNSGENCPMFFVHYRDNGTDFYGIAVVQMSDNTENCYPVAVQMNVWDATFWGDSIISGGESGAGTWGNNTIPTVNDGTFSSTSDNVTPSDTNYSTSAIQTRVNNALSGLFSGLTGVYGIYMLDTASGADRIFSELTHIYGVLYDTGSDAFLNRYLQSMYNPLSAVIAMHLLPYQFAASAIFGASVTEKLTISGYPVSDKISTKYSVTAPKYNILKPLGKVAFPAVSINRHFGGYADFAPYTQCILHLPFIGAIELKTNAIAHGSITVEYLCDIVSGNVTARICCTDIDENTQYVQTASGNCAYNLPLFTMSQDGAAVGKMLSGAAGIVSGALAGNAAGIATGAAGVVGAAVESSFSPRSTQISGNMGGNSMLMSNLDIWLEIIRPVWCENMYYQKLHGIPSEMSNCIADCSQDAPGAVPYDGYLQISKIDLDNVPCTEQEKQEIESLLKQGVFIRGNEL